MAKLRRHQSQRGIRHIFPSSRLIYRLPWHQRRNDNELTDSGFNYARTLTRSAAVPKDWNGTTTVVGVDTQLTYKPTKSKFLKPQDVGTGGQGFAAILISMVDLRLRTDAAGPVIAPPLNQHGDSVRAEFIQETG